MRFCALLALLLLTLGEHFIVRVLAGNLTAALTCLDTASIVYVDSTRQDALILASQVWNKLNASTTALALVSPTNASQVQQAITCLYTAGIPAVPRSGGHSYEGYSVLPDAVTIDLRNLNSVVVNLEANQPTAIVGAGTRLGEIYYKVSGATNDSHTIVGGTCPPVGVGGFILGGGIGPLSRNYGLGCDQLLKVTLVDYQGNIIIATADINEDLFWASCGGGGGNFGIVVEYELKLVPLFEESITTFSFTVPPSQISDFLLYLTMNVSMTADPRLGFKMVLFNAISQRGPVPQVVGHWLGPFQELDDALEGCGLGKKGLFDRNGYKSMQGKWLDALVTGAYMSSVKSHEDLINVQGFEADRLYFKYKSFFLSPMTPPSHELFDALLEWVREAGGDTGDAYVFVELLGPRSAIANIPGNATAFAHRNALALIQFGMEWENGKGSATNLQAVINAEISIAHFLPENIGRYINYIDVQTPSLNDYYGQAALEKLQKVKAMFDPQGYFTTTPMSIRTPSNIINTTAVTITQEAPAPSLIPGISISVPVRASIPVPAPSLALLKPISVPPLPPIQPPTIEVIQPSLLFPPRPILPVPLSSGGYRIKPFAQFFASIPSQLIKFSSFLLFIM